MFWLGSVGFIMSNQNLLPHKVDPFRFAENEVRLEGIIPLKDMERLHPSLQNDEGQVVVNMTFGVDEQGIRIVRGHYDTHLMLQCQRCMEALKYAVSGDLLLGIVAEKDIDTLPKGYDAAIVKDGSLILKDVIEDELILSLPIVPMHETIDCKGIMPLKIGSDQQAEIEKENPFKVIELLRDKRNLDK